jgi:hypothetical protein
MRSASFSFIPLSPRRRIQSGKEIQMPPTLKKPLRLLLPMILVITATGFAQLPSHLGQGRQPRLAAGQGAAIYAIFGRDDGGVFVCRSADAGQTWDVPSLVTTLKGKIALGMHRGPRITVAGEALIVSAIVGIKGGGTDGDLLAVRSTDGGRSWLAPAMISDAPGAAREGLHNLASDGRNRVAAVWLDLRDGKTTVMSALSTDGGVSWGRNQLVYRSPDASVCECCHPSAAFDSEGTLHVMFRNSLGGNRDMYLASSRDGTTWSDATKLGSGSWRLNACPMDGGDLVTDGGKPLTVWRRGEEIFRAAPGQPETKIDTGRQPTLATLRGEVWIGYIKGTTLWIVPPGGKPWQLAAVADAPTIVASRDHVFISWESDGQSNMMVLK